MLDQLSPLTMIQVDFIQMNDYAADSCAMIPTAFLFGLRSQTKIFPIGDRNKFYFNFWESFANLSDFVKSIFFRFLCWHCQVFDSYVR